MVKTEPSGPRNLVTCSGQAQTHANVFLSIAFQKQCFYFEARFGSLKNINF